jgi:hypothetical protein
LVTETLPHRPLHAAPSSVQQVPSDVHTAPGETQAPLFPHATICPQLFFANPQPLPWHVFVVDSGAQPHELYVHAWPPLHSPQSIESPQLSVVGPQRFVHQAGFVLHVQAPPTHSLSTPQSVEQLRVCLQLSSVGPHLPAQVTEFESGLHGAGGELAPSAPGAPPPSAGGGTLGLGDAAASCSLARRTRSKSTPARVEQPALIQTAAPKAARPSVLRGTVPTFRG